MVKSRPTQFYFEPGIILSYEFFHEFIKDIPNIGYEGKTVCLTWEVLETTGSSYYIQIELIDVKNKRYTVRIPYLTDKDVPDIIKYIQEKEEEFNQGNII